MVNIFMILTGYLCTLDKNVYGIEFTRFRIRDMDSDQVLFEITKPGSCKK